MWSRHPGSIRSRQLSDPFRRVWMAPVVLLTLSGCGAGAASGPTAVVRDSAGVTIVENSGATLPEGSGWSLGLDPSLIIGSFDGPEENQLFRVRGAMRLPDGRIAVANEGTQEIRFYGPDGGHLLSMGGEGEGPGEFSAPLLAGRLGDSLVVLDRRLRRISLLHPDQGFVRSLAIAEPVAAYPIMGWFFSTGSMLIQDLPGLDSGGFDQGFQRAPVPYKSCDMTGALLTDFGALPGAENVTVTRQTNHGLATILQSVPFGKAPQVAVAGDRMYFGSQDDFEIQVLRSDGTLERIIRMNRAQVPVTDADLGAFVEEDLAGRDESERPSRRQTLDEMPRMEFYPAHGALIADGEGYLFVEDYRTPGMDRVPVSVFDPEGALVGRFELPGDLRVLEIGENHLLAVHEDELEVEYLHLYEMTRPGR